MAIDTRDAQLNAMKFVVDENIRLRERVAKLEARLEIDHYWRPVGDGTDDAMERVEIPPEDRDSWPDGIECRDETIKLLEERITALERRFRPRGDDNGQAG